MAKRNKNLQTTELVRSLKQLAIEKKVGIWKRIAVELEKPTRNKRAVNISRINRYAKENEIVIVPGKVLSGGTLTHKLSVAAESFSQQAKEKLVASGAQVMTIPELMKQHPEGKQIRIIG